MDRDRPRVRTIARSESILIRFTFKGLGRNFVNYSGFVNKIKTE